MYDASRACLRLLAAAPDDEAQLRVVIAADVRDCRCATPDLDRAAARIQGPVHWRQIASVHLDGADASDVVREASAMVDPADLGDDDAEFARRLGRGLRAGLVCARARSAYLLEDLDSAE